MRKWLFVLAASTALYSCSKDELDSDKASILKLDNIKFHGISTGTGIQGIAKFQFLVAKDNSSDLDTTGFTDTFTVDNPFGFNHNYNFNTPEKTKQFNFSVTLTIENGVADSVNVKSVSYKRKGVTYMDLPLYFTTNDGMTFKSGVKTVNF